MKEAAKRIKVWRDSPVIFVREVFNVDPDDWQLDALEAYRTNQRTAMLASKGVGKTCCLSWIVWHFLVCYPHPKVVATSISEANLRDGLATEMAKWMNASPILRANYVWTKTRLFLKANPETWYLSFRTWSKSADANQQADALAGIHAEYTLFVLDESGGIPQAVAATAEAALSTGKVCKMVQCGNPTHLSGPLYRAATADAEHWKVIHINSDPENPKRAKRVDIKWAQQQIDSYGRDSDFVKVNILGKFPSASMNSLLGPNEVQAAMGRQIAEDKYASAQKRLGVDVSRYGGDLNIIFPRQGLRSFQPTVVAPSRSNDIAAKIALIKNNFKSEMEFIDGTGGYGSGVVDSLIQAGYDPQEINFSSKSPDNQYYNMRSYMWFKMADWVKRGGVLPDVPELKKELCAPTYSFKKGRFVLESKDLIRARLGHSTDYADALALTFAMPEMPAGANTVIGKLLNKGKKMLTEYDPFADV